MDRTSRWIVLLVIIASASIQANGSSVDDDDDFQRCESVVNNWAISQLNQENAENKHTLRDLLFFLHIPRTGGRTYFHCFLKKLYSSQLECPRSYDKLRFDPRKADCRLLVTHDDYSMMTKLLKEKTSVVTILRNPVDRVFSTYEFSIEVAARFLVHPNLTSAIQTAKRLRRKAKGVSTLDIWPWKHLVPWMREDLFARRESRLRKTQKQNHVENRDSYDMEDMAMPLQHYINDPMALDIVHNGATFQIAGLTNNSYVPEAHVVRGCVQKYHSLGEHVLDVAKRRLDHMLYVGLTEDHKGSATTFAHVVGTQVISQLASNSSIERLARDKSEHSSSIKRVNSLNESYKSIPDDENTSESVPSEVVEGSRESAMSAGKLMESYEGCISSLRKSQSRRRINSLKNIAPVNFTKEARLRVPESTLDQLKSLNRLDMELYEYARDIFARQHERTIQKLKLQEGDIKTTNSGKTRLKEIEEIVVSNSFGPSPWIEILLVTTILVGVCIFVNARRRTSKVKV